MYAIASKDSLVIGERYSLSNLHVFMNFIKNILGERVHYYACHSFLYLPSFFSSIIHLIYYHSLYILLITFVPLQSLSLMFL